VGMSSFAAGAVAKQFGYRAAFVMGVAGIGLAALTGRIVFYRAAAVPVTEDELVTT
jgi:hypothetical protein